MDDNNASLADRVDAAIGEFLHQEEVPGIATSFLLIAAVAFADGTQGLQVVHPFDQGPHLSLGLVDYADEWVRDDVRNSFLAHIPGDDL